MYVDSGSEVTFNNFDVGFKNITCDITDADLPKFGIQSLHDLEKLMDLIYFDGLSP